MELSTAHIDFIQRDIRAKGISIPELESNLVDHICCAIENNPEKDFQKAYAEAIHAFGKDGIERVQKETVLLLILKRSIQMKKTMYVLGYLAVCLSVTGLLFKIMHWPSANIMLVLGIALLNFGFLPMYFYDRYKRAIG